MRLVSRGGFFLLLPGALLALTGCSSLLTQSAGAGAGVGAAAISNAITKNGAITAGIGLGTQAAAVAGVEALEKTVHAAEQDEIAQVGGNVPVGGVATWKIHHKIPIEDNEHGELTVVQYILPALPRGEMPPFFCKEIIFSVDTDNHHKIDREFYTADICQDGTTWKWATAEPATERWGALQ